MRERSFGGVVVRGGDGGAPVEVAVIVPHGRHILGLPKGGPEQGETPLQTATREIREETGLVAEPNGEEELGAVRYWYSRRGRRVFKTVGFFLFRFVSGSTDDHDHEVDEVRWLPIEEAQVRLTHSGEREMVSLAASKLRADR